MQPAPVSNEPVESAQTPNFTPSHQERVLRSGLCNYWDFSLDIHWNSNGKGTRLKRSPPPLHEIAKETEKQHQDQNFPWPVLEARAPPGDPKDRTGAQVRDLESFGNAAPGMCASLFFAPLRKVRNGPTRKKRQQTNRHMPAKCKKPSTPASCLDFALSNIYGPRRHLPRRSKKATPTFDPRASDGKCQRAALSRTW